MMLVVLLPLMLCSLRGMSEEEFAQQRSALVSNKLVRDRALGDEAARGWEAVWSQR
jgi:secreted Zn-dependent insulinase-like peptidase